MTRTHTHTHTHTGCYRGQYKKGLRCGFGTRTSSAYEVKGEDHSISTSTSEPSLSSITMPKSTPDSRVNILKKSRTLQRQKESISSLYSNPGQHKDEVAQIYEGEWLHDKRHGNGVLKVIGKYTYYGQWNGNARTGYGVLVTEDGTKEEGEWHNGTLIAVAKRHKVLMFKSHQLEQRVKEARTKSLQAAETARSKAELAVSRALSAVNKSRSAIRVAERAHSDARDALVKAVTYKNAPTVSGEWACVERGAVHTCVCVERGALRVCVCVCVCVWRGGLCVHVCVCVWRGGSACVCVC